MVRGEASFDVEVEVDDLNWKPIVVVQRKASFDVEVDIVCLNWKRMWWCEVRRHSMWKWKLTI